MLAHLLVQDYLKLHKQITSELGRLQKLHSDIDKTVVDLEHEIEFSKPDACTMVQIFKHFQKVLTERRFIKNDIQKLQQFNITQEKMKQVTKTCTIEKKRTYTPRILTDLNFNNTSSLLKSRKKLVV